MPKPSPTITLTVSLLFDGVEQHDGIKHPVSVDLFQFPVMDLENLLPYDGKQGVGSNEHKKTLLAKAFLTAVAFRQMILKSMKAGELSDAHHVQRKAGIALDQIDTAFCLYYAAVTGKVLGTNIEWNDK